VAAWMEGMAAQQPPHAQVRALEPAVKSQALGGVAGARRMEPALPAQKRRQHELIPANQQQKSAREQRRLGNDGLRHAG
jgi:hypothetical protein